MDVPDASRIFGKQVEVAAAIVQRYPTAQLKMLSVADTVQSITSGEIIVSQGLGADPTYSTGDFDWIQGDAARVFEDPNQILSKLLEHHNDYSIVFSVEDAYEVLNAASVPTMIFTILHKDRGTDAAIRDAQPAVAALTGAGLAVVRVYDTLASTMADELWYHAYLQTSSMPATAVTSVLSETHSNEYYTSVKYDESLSTAVDTWITERVTAYCTSTTAATMEFYFDVQSTVDLCGVHIQWATSAQPALDISTSSQACPTLTSADDSSSVCTAGLRREHRLLGHVHSLGSAGAEGWIPDLENDGTVCGRNAGVGNFVGTYVECRDACDASLCCTAFAHQSSTLDPTEPCASSRCCPTVRQPL